MGLCFMILEKLPAEKLCARFYCPDHGETKLAQPTKEFYFFFWFKVAPIFKITTGQTDGSILFYFLDGDNRLAKVVSKLYCGKNSSPCNPTTSVQFCNDIFIATDQMPYL